MSEIKKLVDAINMWTRLTKAELKKFTHANIQMDERDVDDLTEIKEILERQDELKKLICKVCGSTWMIDKDDMTLQPDEELDKKLLKDTRRMCQIEAEKSQPDEELVEKALYECLDFISGLPIEQVSSEKKLKWVNAYRSLLQSRQPKEWEDFGYENGWSEDPPEIKKCRELKHETVETSDDPPFRRHNWTVKCYVCKIIYHYDSS
jgi:hypothetical protein